MSNRPTNASAGPRFHSSAKQRTLPGPRIRSFSAILQQDGSLKSKHEQKEPKRQVKPKAPGPLSWSKTPSPLRRDVSSKESEFSNSQPMPTPFLRRGTMPRNDACPSLVDPSNGDDGTNTVRSDIVERDLTRRKRLWSPSNLPSLAPVASSAIASRRHKTLLAAQQNILTTRRQTSVERCNHDDEDGPRLLRASSAS
jgi:hypothetical protein